MKRLLLIAVFLTTQLAVFAASPKTVSGTIRPIVIGERVSMATLSDKIDKDYTFSARVDEMIVIKNIEIINGVEITTIVTL